MSIPNSNVGVHDRISNSPPFIWDSYNFLSFWSNPPRWIWILISSFIDSTFDAKNSASLWVLLKTNCFEFFLWQIDDIISIVVLWPNFLGIIKNWCIFCFLLKLLLMYEKEFTGRSYIFEKNSFELSKVAEDPIIWNFFIYFFILFNTWYTLEPWKLV